MEFKSQICTSREQSERLLALGLKRKTADMGLVYVTHDPSGKEIEPEPEFIGVSDELWECETRQTVLFSKQKLIPAWSLHRLIELMPEVIQDALLTIFKDSIRYEALVFDRIEVLNDVVSDNMYDNAIATIEWLIKEGYFNKDYLKEKQ